MSQYHSQVQAINNRITELSVATKVYKHEVYEDVIEALYEKWGIPALNHDGDGFSGADSVDLDDLVELTNRLNAELSDERDLYVTPIADCYIEEEEDYDFSPLIIALDRLFIQAYQEALDKLEAKVIDLGYGNIHLANELRQAVIEAFEVLRADETPFKTSDSLEGWREFVEANISLFVQQMYDTNWDRAVEKFLSPQNETNLNWLYNYLEGLADEYEARNLTLSAEQQREVVTEAVRTAKGYEQGFFLPIILNMETGEFTCGGWQNSLYVPTSEGYVCVGKVKSWENTEPDFYEFIRDFIAKSFTSEKAKELADTIQAEDLVGEAKEAWETYVATFKDTTLDEKIETEIAWIDNAIQDSTELAGYPLYTKQIVWK